MLCLLCSMFNVSYGVYLEATATAADPFVVKYLSIRDMRAFLATWGVLESTEQFAKIFQNM